MTQWGLEEGELRERKELGELKGRGYTMQVPAGRRLRLTLSGLPADYDLVLFEPGNPFPRAVPARSGTADEEIAVRAGAGGRWGAVVPGYQGAHSSSATYRLRVWTEEYRTYLPRAGR